MNGWVVVLFGPECEEYPDMRCVLEVLGPFQTSEDAAKFFERVPKWTSPHFMILHDPGAWVA